MLNGISVNGISVNGISVNGTEFAGAHLLASLSNVESLELRIDDVSTLSGANSDVTAYAISAAADGGWISLCGYEPDGSVKLALAVSGTWNAESDAWTEGARGMALEFARASGPARRANLIASFHEGAERAT